MNTVKIKFGNHLCDDFIILSSDSKTCRTKEQVEAVIKLIQEDKDIVFFSVPSTMFEYEDVQYNNTFSLCFYKKDGYMWVCRVTSKGKIKDMRQVPHSDMTSYGMVNKTEQEHIDEIALCIPVNERLGITNY